MTGSDCGETADRGVAVLGNGANTIGLITLNSPYNERIGCYPSTISCGGSIKKGAAAIWTDSSRVTVISPSNGQSVGAAMISGCGPNITVSGDLNAGNGQGLLPLFGYDWTGTANLCGSGVGSFANGGRVNARGLASDGAAYPSIDGATNNGAEVEFDYPANAMQPYQINASAGVKSCVSPINVNTNGGVVTVTLPSVAAGYVRPNSQYCIINDTGAYAGTNNITVTSQSGVFQFNGTTSLALETNGGSVTIAALGAIFTGSISTTTLTVSAMTYGVISVGSTITGAGVTAGTVVTALGSATGGTGTYTVNNSQTVGSEVLQSNGGWQVISAVGTIK